MKLDEIMDLLPEIFKRSISRNSPVDALIKLMHTLHLPTEEILNSLDAFTDPRRTRPELIPFLAYWMNLNWLLNEELLRSKGVGFMRELMANGAFLSQWRGTAPGLRMLISIILGSDEIQIEKPVSNGYENQLPFHFHIRISKNAMHYDSVIRKIIQKEKPAYVTYDLFYE